MLPWDAGLFDLRAREKKIYSVCITVLAYRIMHPCVRVLELQAAAGAASCLHAATMMRISTMCISALLHELLQPPNESSGRMQEREPSSSSVWAKARAL